MAQLRAKQIKLSAVGDLLVGGANGNGVVLPAGGDKTVLKVVAGGLQYAQQVAEDVAFSGAGFTSTDVKGAVVEATTKAATALTEAVAAEVLARDAAVKVADDRAKAAEGVLTTDLAAEVTRATGAEGVLTTAVAGEVTRATAAEAALQSAIDAIGDAGSDALDAEIARAIAAEGVLTADLAAEVSRAGGAESALGGRIDGEVTRATAEEARIAGLVTAEVTRAEAAELVLTNAIATEVTDRTAAVAGEATARTAAIKVADDRALAAEAGLQASIDAITGLNALHFSGELAPTDTLPASPKQGDVYRVATAGATDFLGTGLEVNVGDFIAYTGTVWVKFDNTDPTFTGDSNITVTGSAHAGFSLSLTGIVSVAKGGTGLSAAGADHSVLTSAADGSLSYVQVSGLRTAAGVLVVDATSGKLVATAATVNGDAALTYTTKGYVDTKINQAADQGNRVFNTEDFAQAATAANAVVTLSEIPAGAVSVFFNGVKLAKTGYTVNGRTVTLVDSAIGYGVDAGDTISTEYVSVYVNIS